MQDYVWGWVIDEYENVNVENILQNANAHLILMDVKIAGKVDIKKLGTEIKDIEDEYESDEELPLNIEKEYVDEIVKAINDYVQLVVVYTDSNDKIAEAEAYTSYVEEYDDWSEQMESWYEPNIRFIFSDGTPVDGETYLNDELDSFFDALNDFIDDLNEDYDLDLDYVDPDDMTK
ncbi:MAG: hypothetical protein HC906_12130 [Bacteroidales bacterium]|nr:hypothetical protein [Bacteroidales bacterium]